MGSRWVGPRLHAIRADEPPSLLDREGKWVEKWWAGQPWHKGVGECRSGGGGAHGGMRRGAIGTRNAGMETTPKGSKARGSKTMERAKEGERARCADLGTTDSHRKSCREGARAARHTPGWPSSHRKAQHSWWRLTLSVGALFCSSVTSLHPGRPTHDPVAEIIRTRNSEELIPGFIVRNASDPAARLP
jgi:hypothetical protein